MPVPSEARAIHNDGQYYLVSCNTKGERVTAMSYGWRETAGGKGNIKHTKTPGIMFEKQASGTAACGGGGARCEVRACMWVGAEGFEFCW